MAQSSHSTTTSSTKHPRTLLIPHLVLFVFFLIAPNLHAATVSLTWNANNESDLAGYKIYKRLLPSIDYGSPIFSGLPPNPASPQLTISNLLEGTSYGFIATAYDSSGNESSPSTEKQITTSTASNSESTTNNNSFPPDIASPAPGTTLTSTSVRFTGNHTSTDIFHLLWIGTTSGSFDLHRGRMTTHSQTVLDLPTTGTIYVRYWSIDSSNPNTWFFTEQTYTMNVASGRNNYERAR